MWAIGLAVALAGCSASAPTSTGPPQSAAAAASPATAAGATVVRATIPPPSPFVAGLPGRIAFVDEKKNAAGHAQVYLQNPDGTNLGQLVVSNFDDNEPVISPNGNRVVFQRFAPDGTPPEDGGIFVVNIDGSGLQKVDTYGEDASWSPDGSQLVLTRDLFDSGAPTPYSVSLWIEKPDGSDAHQITRKGLRCDNVCSGGWQDNQARWSPDGRSIVFLRDVYTKPEHVEIVTASPDGSDVTVVNPKTIEPGNPSWSRDGRLILFQSPPEPSHEDQNLFTIKPDRTGLTQLTSHLSKDPNGVEGAFHASWSPDGASIVFSHYPGASGFASLYVIKADGSEMVPISEERFNATDADWGASQAP